MGINSPVTFKKFEKFLFYVGCTFKRQKGSHRVYDRLGMGRPVIVPDGREVNPAIIRSNLRTLGISTEEFLRIIKEL